MTQQVIPLMGTFGRVLSGDSSFLLDMGAAGGMNFWGVFFFFLASPLSIPAALVPLEYLPFAMNILLLLKMMLCALTAALFFPQIFSGKKHLGHQFAGGHVCFFRFLR